MLILVPKLFTVDILYFIPKSLILQEFVWQCQDVHPLYPRIHKFLDYWKTNDLAVIHSINIIENESGITVEREFKL